MTFIPGFSTLKGEPQDPEENEKAYAESQQQRALERKLREEKRDLEVMKAQGADPEAIKAQRAKVQKASADIDQFCEDTGRARRRNREYTPVNATWPDKGTWGDVTKRNPPPTSAKNVAPQATQSAQSVVQSNLQDTIEATLGIKKGTPMGTVEALANANPDYKTGQWGYRNNCQRCVQTYELRRRGYSVEAMPRKKSGNTVVWGSEIFNGYGVSQAEALKAYTLRKSEAAVKKELANAPDGARYSIYVEWKGSRSTHVFVAEKVNGNVMYVDPQLNKQDASGYFALGTKNNFGYFRMDDKPITTDGTIIANVVRKGK
jgi:hypothetical protein